MELCNPILTLLGHNVVTSYLKKYSFFKRYYIKWYELKYVSIFKASTETLSIQEAIGFFSTLLFIMAKVFLLSPIRIVWAELLIVFHYTPVVVSCLEIQAKSSKYMKFYNNKHSPMFINFWTFLQGLLSYYGLKRLKFYYISLHI